MERISVSRRREPARDQRLPERQEVDEDIDERRRVARDVAAVGQDLRLQLGVEPVEPGAGEPLLLRQRQADQRDGDRGVEPRQAGLASSTMPARSTLACRRSDRTKSR